MNKARFQKEQDIVVLRDFFEWVLDDMKKQSGIKTHLANLKGIEISDMEIIVNALDVYLDSLV